MSKDLISQAMRNNNARHGYTIVGHGYLTRGDGTGTFIADQNNRMGFYWQQSDDGNQRIVGIATVDDSIVFENNRDYEKFAVDLGYKPNDSKLYILGQNSYGMNSGGGSTINERKIAELAQGIKLPLAVTADKTQPSLKVFINSWTPAIAGTGVTLFPITEVNLTDYIPSSSNQMCYAAIFIQSDYATIEITTSTPRSTSGLPLSRNDLNEAVAAATAGDTAVYAVKLVNGQTTITQSDLNNNGWPLQPYVSLATSSGGGTGDVTGPGSSTTDDIATYADTTGKVIKDGGKKITDLALGAGTSVANDFVQFTNTDGRTLKDGGLSLSTDGTLASNSDSLIPSQKAVKGYVDATAAGLSAKQSVFATTTAALPTNTYSNGSSGIGATLTGIATGVLTVDGLTVPLNARLWVKDEVTQANCGLYVCTVAGAIGIAYVLTRATDANTSAELVGAYALTDGGGTANAGKGFVVKVAAPIVIGTTAIVIVQFSDATQTITLTGDMTGSGTTTIATTLATVNSNVGTFAGGLSVTVDAKGLITAIATSLINLATQVTGLLGLANGGTHKDLSGTGPGFLKQATNGADVTVAAVDLSTSDATGTLAAGRFPALTGDVTTSAGALATTLATVNGNVGTFSRVKSVTANAKGLITAITQGLVDLASEVTGLLPLANGGTNVNLSATGGPHQVLKQDASHVVSSATLNTNDTPQGFATVRVVATSNASVTSAPSTIDGVTLGSKDLILNTANTTGSENGLWEFVSAGSALVRPMMYSAGVQTSRSFTVLVTDGTVGKGQTWYMTNTSLAVIVDTTATTWAKGISDAGSLVNTVPISSLKVYLVAQIGDGSDGAFSASSGTTTLTRDMYWTDITLTGTAKINLAGWRVFHTGKLDCTAAGAGAIFNDGAAGGNASSGTGGSGGTAPSSNTIGGGSTGPNGANGRATSGAGSAGTAGVASSPGNGGAGGNGGNGGAGTGGAGGAAQTGGSVSSPMSLHRWAVDLLRGTSLLVGGASGASGSSGGSNGAQSGGGGQAGSGAGVVYISGYEFARSGSTPAGTITAKGGVGGNGATSAGAANGDGGGGGGGGGGWIIGSWFVLSGSAGTNEFDASGGTGGNAGAAGGTLATVASGGDGGNGGRITLINMSTGVVTETTGSTGTSHSGRTGGAGNTFQASL